MPNFETRESIAPALRYIVVTLVVTAAGFAAQSDARLHPEGLGGAPAPSSFVLVLAGLAVVLGWNWWRSRSRAQRTARD